MNAKGSRCPQPSKYAREANGNRRAGHRFDAAPRREVWDGGLSLSVSQACDAFWERRGHIADFSFGWQQLKQQP